MAWLERGTLARAAWPRAIRSSVSTGNGLTSGQAFNSNAGSSAFTTGTASTAGFFYGGAGQTDLYRGANSFVSTGAILAESATVYGTEFLAIYGPLSLQAEYAFAFADEMTDAVETVRLKRFVPAEHVQLSLVQIAERIAERQFVNARAHEAEAARLCEPQTDALQREVAEREQEQPRL